LRRPAWTGGAKRSDTRGFLSFAFGYLGKALLQVVAQLHVVHCVPRRCALKNSIRGAKLTFSRGFALILHRATQLSGNKATEQEDTE
jgi:hypothetical protein